MKRTKQAIIVAICLTMIHLTSNLAFAEVGDGGSSGGSFNKLQSQSIKSFLNSKLLIIILKKYKENFATSDIYNLPENGIELYSRFNELRNNNRLYNEFKAIEENKFDAEGPCFETDDKGVDIEVDASTTDNEPNGKICINGNRLSEKKINLSELIGMIIHEIAHHYGDKDTNHTLAFAVASTAHLSIKRSVITYNAINRKKYRSSLCHYLNLTNIKEFINKSGVVNDLCGDN